MRSQDCLFVACPPSADRAVAKLSLEGIRATHGLDWSGSPMPCRPHLPEKSGQATESAAMWADVSGCDWHLCLRWPYAFASEAFPVGEEEQVCRVLRLPQLCPHPPQPCQRTINSCTALVLIPHPEMLILPRSIECPKSTEGRSPAGSHQCERGSVCSKTGQLPVIQA